MNQSKTHFKNSLFVLALLLSTFPSLLFCQNLKEVEILQEIEKIDQTIKPLLGVSQLQPFLKKYKEIARKNRTNPQLSSVTNAVIGK